MGPKLITLGVIGRYSFFFLFLRTFEIPRQFYEILDRGERNDLLSLFGPHFHITHQFRVEFFSTLILLRTGFLSALKLTLQVREEGLITGGPPCGPWVFINSSTHRRQKDDVFGNQDSPYVQASNT